VIRLGVIGNRDYPDLGGMLKRLLAMAPTLGVDMRLEATLKELAPDHKAPACVPEDVDALLTLGGDGTLLRGARFLGGREIPVLGVNLGRLGFLSACGPEEMETAVRRLATGDYRGETRMMLEGRPGMPEDPRRWYALNDIVLHKSGKARVIWLRVEVDGEEVASYAADGIVMSTPTGSTAYNLSVGGPVVVPEHPSIIIAPISAHALSIRPVVVGPDVTVMVHADDDGTDRLVTVDGQVGATLGTSESLMVRRATRSVILVRFPEMTFFTRMRRKLGWGLPPDDTRA
jgi:NAD+ kinase